MNVPFLDTILTCTKKHLLRNGVLGFDKFNEFPDCSILK